MKGILGKKLGMTQIFAEDGRVVPVTVVQAGPCFVVQRKTSETDGYDAVQLGLVEDRARAYGAVARRRGLPLRCRRSGLHDHPDDPGAGNGREMGRDLPNRLHIDGKGTE